MHGTNAKWERSSKKTQSGKRNHVFDGYAVNVVRIIGREQVSAVNCIHTVLCSFPPTPSLDYQLILILYSALNYLGSEQRQIALYPMRSRRAFFYA